MKVLPRDAGVLAMGKLETDTDAEEDIPLWWLDLWCGKSLWLLLLCLDSALWFKCWVGQSSELEVTEKPKPLFPHSPSDHNFTLYIGI